MAKQRSKRMIKAQCMICLSTYVALCLLRFLLRWSPSFFAHQCPHAFQYDPETNRLSLRDGVASPWLRTFGRGGAANTDESWLYCTNCADQHKHRVGNFIPFRDKASQQWMKRVHKPEEETRNEESHATQAPAQPQPEEEPEGQGDEGAEAAFVQEDDEEEELEEEHVIQDPPAKRPSLEEYQVKWKTLLEKHSRPVAGEFGRDNLVPSPVVVLWQDCRSFRFRFIATWRFNFQTLFNLFHPSLSPCIHSIFGMIRTGICPLLFFRYYKLI